jgi:hypothetical protein
MKAIGLVFLYDRNLGPPKEVSRRFSEFFPRVSENLVLEGLLELSNLKDIMDFKRIYWAGIKENFETISKDEEMIGKVAWKVFSDYSGIEPSDEVSSLIYSGKKASWGFTLMVCVLYIKEK